VSVPEVSVPEVSVPSVSIPSVSLPVAAEHDADYDRDDWGPHNSDLCRGAVGSPDPYTGTPIDTCNVDHVVALHEAHESGGWAWPAEKKQRFSQAPDNHVASRACVNQSKGGDDIFEWSDADIARSSACGDGYSVTPAGRCLLARITAAVKSAWGLSVDPSEADALGHTLAGCAGQTPEFSAESQATTTTSPPTTVAPSDDCVIAGRTAAEYDVVTGIGEVLSARLFDAQPFSSRTDLEAVRGIGPARSEAVWSHFCTP
jgi:DNA uptake protein ComE-like DNA-binding protein